MKLNNKNVLITGAHGFVGSHVVESLIASKANIIGTFQTSNPKSYFYQKNLQQNITLVHADITDFEKMSAIVAKFHIDYIFHLAAQPIVDVAYQNPKETLQTNINGTINLLECARLYPSIQGVVVASSDKAYGKLDNGKYKETDALKGDHPYEVSKSAADLICNAYFKTYGIPVVTTRFGNIYGEGDLNFSRIIPGIVESIIKKKKLSLRSNGKFIRDYLYVKDVARGYLLCAENINDIKGEAFNFGSNETLSVLELIKKAEEILKVKIQYENTNSAINEIPYQSLDSTKAAKILGWKQEYYLNSTLPSIVDYYKSIV